MAIPLIRPTLYEQEACFADFRTIWAGGRLTAGPFTERLEEAICRRLQVAYAVCVGSCTSGLMLVQRALGLKGEVILPTFTWTATGTSLLWNNVTPVFVDSRPSDFNIDPDSIESAVSPRTAAICPVAVFGVPVDCEPIVEIGTRCRVPVFFDSAQALGATYRGRPVGRFGAAEVFSLSPTKVVSAAEMGVVTTGDETLARRMRQMRDYGKSTRDEDIVELGLSVRPSEFHAVIGYYNLRHADESMTHRGRMMERYRQRLGGVPGIRFQQIGTDRTSSNNYMVVFIGDGCPASRDELFTGLRARGIECKRYFYPCLHRQTVYRQAAFRCASPLAIAEQASREGLALPLHGHIAPTDVDRVTEAVIEICR